MTQRLKTFVSARHAGADAAAGNTPTFRICDAQGPPDALASPACPVRPVGWHTTALAGAERPTALARSVVREACADTPGRLDDIVLVVGELVANAVRHTPGPLRLIIERHQQHIFLRVCDSGAGSAPAGCADPSPMAQSGRGLQLAEALAERWFVEATADGKAVIAQFDAPRIPADPAQAVLAGDREQCGRPGTVPACGPCPTPVTAVSGGTGFFAGAVRGVDT